MADTLPTKADEWRAHWTLVLTAFVGFSLSSIAIYSTGLMIKPLSEEFGFSRTEITIGISLAGAMSIPFAPFVGGLMDRWGVRRLVLPGIVLTSLSLASMSLANGSMTQWVILWVIYGLIILLVKSTFWTGAVTGVFTKGRSMALSITVAGAALAATGAPPLTQFLADTYGWRMAYVLLAIIWGTPSFILCWFFLYDAHDRHRLENRKRASDAQEAMPKRVLPGLSVAEAWRSAALWRIGISTLIMLVLSAALVVHKVPLLTDLGMSRVTAAWLAGLSGLAGIAGKLVTGWLMERFVAGWVAGITTSVTAIALVFLLDPIRTETTIVLSMIIVGYAGGTSLQICAYLTGIYAGTRNFGKIFGVMASIIAVSSATGPLVGGVVYDFAGSYNPLIVAGIPASLICGVLIMGLGVYPEWSKALDVGRRRSKAPV